MFVEDLFFKRSRAFRRAWYPKVGSSSRLILETLGFSEGKKKEGRRRKEKEEGRRRKEKEGEEEEEGEGEGKRRKQ